MSYFRTFSSVRGILHSVKYKIYRSTGDVYNYKDQYVINLDKDELEQVNRIHKRPYHFYKLKVDKYIDDKLTKKI